MPTSLGARVPKHIGVYRERFQQRRILRSPEVRDQAVATFSKSKPLAVGRYARRGVDAQPSATYFASFSVTIARSSSC